jgi:hypothetical protein
MSLSSDPFRSADPKKRCPHLGLGDDPATAHGYPSEWNYCHSVKPKASPNLEYQREICLTTYHNFCPAIDAGQKKSMPRDLRMPGVGRTRKLITQWIIVIVSLTFLISAGLIFSGYWVPSWVKKTSLSAWIPEFVLQITMTVTPTMEIEIDASPVVSETVLVTPENSIVSEMPTPSREDITATQTEIASAIRCAYPLESPFGGENRSFLLHKVVAGENMIMLTERYETTEAAIEAVNYFFPSSLWADLVIVIPLNQTNTDGLPSFKPVLLEEEDISLEELAQNLSVSSAELIEFNQLDPSCRSFHGWVLVPAEKITP